MIEGLAREVRPVTRLGGEREAADLGVVGFAEIIPQALPGFQRVDRHGAVAGLIRIGRSEEHTSELQSLMRISYAVFCLKKKKKHEIVRPRLQQKSNNQ